MNPEFLLFIGFSVLFFLAEILLLFYAVRLVKRSQDERQKDFAILDRERQALLSLQTHLVRDVTKLKDECGSLMSSIAQTGVEVEGEWRQLQKRCEEAIAGAEVQVDDVVQKGVSQIQIQKLNLEKSIHDAQSVRRSLVETMNKAQEVFRLFDDSLPPETIAKELHAAKYAEAKKLLNSGVEASSVAKKLGMAYGEVVLLSHIP